MKKIEQITREVEDGYEWIVSCDYIDNIETLESVLTKLKANFKVEGRNLFATRDDVKFADLYIAKEELIYRIDFTREEYDKKTQKGEGFRTFDEFIDEVLSIVKENNGTLKDAVFIANDAFLQL